MYFSQDPGLNERGYEEESDNTCLANENHRKSQLQNKRGEVRTARSTNKNMGGQEI
jgi:hypothetical protein